MPFLDIRTDDGHLLFRFDPVRMLIEVKRREHIELVDLTKYIAPESAKEIASERPDHEWDAAWACNGYGGS